VAPSVSKMVYEAVYTVAEVDGCGIEPRARFGNRTLVPSRMHGVSVTMM
jgi:hypothetical protein